MSGLLISIIIGVLSFWNMQKRVTVFFAKRTVLYWTVYTGSWTCDPQIKKWISPYSGTLFFLENNVLKSTLNRVEKEYASMREGVTVTLDTTVLISIEKLKKQSISTMAEKGVYKVALPAWVYNVVPNLPFLYSGGNFHSWWGKDAPTWF